MIPLYTCEEMKEIEKEEMKKGLSSFDLIDRAGTALYNRVRALLSENGKVLVLCGKGNNGADGYALAEKLHIAGVFCDTVAVDSGKQSEENAFFCKKYQEKCGKAPLNTLPEELSSYSMIVDGIYGSGFHGELKKEIALLSECVKMSGVPLLAIDLPSGVNGSTGQADPFAFRADHTVCLTVYKVGAFVYPGASYCGKVVLDAAIPALPSKRTAIEGFSLPERPDRSNKGTFGTVGIVAGTKNMAGAACLAAKAAYLSGVGLVKVITEECNRVIVQTLLPEAVLYTYDDSTPISEILKECSSCKSLVLGPGLGKKEKQRQIVSAVLENLSLPLVLDADGLNLSVGTDHIENYKGKLIITPHFGEAARLIGIGVSEISSDPLSALSALEKKFGCTVLLKDAHTLVGCPDSGGSLAVNLSGNSGMSTGGSGDVLSGVCGALLAEGLPPYTAAVNAVHIHGKAGNLAAKKYGKRSMLASHILEMLPEIYKGSDPSV